MSVSNPQFIRIVFCVTVITYSLFFLRAIQAAGVNGQRVTIRRIAAGVLGWLALQAVLSGNAFYHSGAFPPRFLLFGILPPILTIIFLFVSRQGRRFVNSLPLLHLTYLNVVRVPIELVLYWLYLDKQVPRLMTFEGRNFDILAGITAPLIAYSGLTKGWVNQWILLAWNSIGVGLLLNIFINGLLSAPTPLQRFAFEQPATAILDFPYCWLPTFIVPANLFGHLVSIRRILNRR